MSLEVHRRFLRRFVPRGARVLEVGAGPGRFTTELAARGCRVVVTDSVPRPAGGARAQGARHAGRALRAARELLDVADTSRYADGEFDVVLAYGGLLSAFDRAADALRDLLRIVGPDGVVVASVVSLLGTWRHHLPDVVVGTGDLPSAADGDGYRMYRWSDVVALVDAAGGMLVDGSASNWASRASPARSSASPPTGTAGGASSSTRSPRAPSPGRATAARTSCSPPAADR